MQRPKLSLSKPKKIILILLMINVVAFSTTQTIAEKYTPSQIVKEDNKDLDYIEKGWQIVNWSYNLIKYFKKPHTA
jgi:hypothetical protein